MASLEEVRAAISVNEALASNNELIDILASLNWDETPGEPAAASTEGVFTQEDLDNAVYEAESRMRTRWWRGGDSGETTVTPAAEPDGEEDDEEIAPEDITNDDIFN